MDWDAIWLSIRLAFWTTVVLIPAGVVLARILVWRPFRAKGLVEALVALPLVLPPTVLGYYLLTGFGRGSVLGGWYENLFGSSLAFSFSGLLAASLIFNVPFAVHPTQRAFEGLPRDLREAAWCCGMSRWRTFWKVEFPLARNGILASALLTFAHTIGEFGVVLMVGGNIPGKTRTVSIAIFDRVEAFDDRAAGMMSLALLLFSFALISFIYLFNDRLGGSWRRRQE